MVFRITNYCDEMCSHCMQESDKNGKHATDEMIDKMISFAKHAPRTTTISISGGEPSSHPNFIKIVEKISKEFRTIPVFILSNGDVLKKFKSLRKIMEMYNNIVIQITTVDKIYPNHKKRFELVNKKLNKLKVKHKDIFNRISIYTELDTGVIPIGRAKKNIEKLSKVSFIANRKSTSCFNMYNSLQEHNGSIFESIDYVKTHSMTSLCKPLITEDGKIKFGEYNECSTVMDLTDLTLSQIKDMKTLQLDISEVNGPCGSCVNNTTMKSFLDKYITKFKKENK